MTNQNVNHPPHYTSHPSGIECIQITEHYNFCIGNAIKYLWRHGLKGGSNDKAIEDLEKAIWYINKEIKGLKTSNPNTLCLDNPLVTFDSIDLVRMVLGSRTIKNQQGEWIFSNIIPLPVIVFYILRSQEFKNVLKSGIYSGIYSNDFYFIEEECRIILHKLEKQGEIQIRKRDYSRNQYIINQNMLDKEHKKTSLLLSKGNRDFQQLNIRISLIENSPSWGI